MSEQLKDLLNIAIYPAIATMIGGAGLYFYANIKEKNKACVIKVSDHYFFSRIENIKNNVKYNFTLS
ncbi:MAG: hypothetical protein ACRDBY_09495, partial [Cetobacterium sp.]